MKFLRGVTGVASVAALALGLAACGGGDSNGGNDADAGGSGDGGTTTIGFVAVGPEGAWRQANETNIQETFTEDEGFDLKFAPAVDLDQKSQIDAFTSRSEERRVGKAWR